MYFVVFKNLQILTCSSPKISLIASSLSPIVLSLITSLGSLRLINKSFLVQIRYNLR
nr:MAG TPA: hypothetical protein [Caudoviricetes sp.]